MGQVCLSNPILQSVSVEVPVYIHASGHVFTTACLELHSVFPTGQSWGFIGLLCMSKFWNSVFAIPFAFDGGAKMTDFTLQET